VELDLTRAPRGELAARTLIEGLAGTDDRAERHFLEMKTRSISGTGRAW
jgi:hypothetical protein